MPESFNETFLFSSFIHVKRSSYVITDIVF